MTFLTPTSEGKKGKPELRGRGRVVYLLGRDLQFPGDAIHQAVQNGLWGGGREGIWGVFVGARSRVVAGSRGGIIGKVGGGVEGAREDKGKGGV